MDNSNKYTLWKNQWENPSAMGYMDYISFNIHPEDVVIISKLFYPEIIEVDGCFFLKGSYSEKNYQSWKVEFGNDKSRIEKAINHVHLYDIFGHCAEEVSDKTFKKVGEVLYSAWRMYFRDRFPNKDIIVEYYPDDEDYGPILLFFQGDSS